MQKLWSICQVSSNSASYSLEQLMKKAFFYQRAQHGKINFLPVYNVKKDNISNSVRTMEKTLFQSSQHGKIHFSTSVHRIEKYIFLPAYTAWKNTLFYQFTTWKRIIFLTVYTPWKKNFSSLHSMEKCIFLTVYTAWQKDTFCNSV